MIDFQICRVPLAPLMTVAGFGSDLSSAGYAPFSVDIALSSYNGEMNPAEEGKEALRCYQGYRKKGGRETIPWLLQIDPDVKAIVSSCYSNAPIMANYQEYGFPRVIA